MGDDHPRGDDHEHDRGPMARKGRTGVSDGLTAPLLPRDPGRTIPLCDRHGVSE